MQQFYLIKSKLFFAIIEYNLNYLEQIETTLNAKNRFYDQMKADCFLNDFFFFLIKYSYFIFL